VKVGDRVKLIKGNPYGIVGTIRQVHLMTRPMEMALENAKPEEWFKCEADDGTKFCGWQDDLELLE
jgi:hypothetical protein